MANRVGKIGNTGRERRDSMGESIEEHLKRKREMWGEEGKEEAGIADIFKKSNRTVRSPTGKGIKEEWKEEMRKLFEELREEIKEGMKSLGKEMWKKLEEEKEMIREELEKSREDRKIKEEKWNKEREEIKEQVRILEREIEELMIKKGKEGEDGRWEGEEGKRRDGRKEEEWRERVRELERKWERKEKGDRRKNVVIKGVKEGEASLKEKVEEVIKMLGIEVKIEEIRRIEAGKKERGSMIVVRVENEEAKRNIVRNKWKLKGGDIWIEEDLTWEERRIKWRIREIARRERIQGKRIRMGQEGLWIKGVWWRWDRVRDELRDERGRSWVEVNGEDGKKQETREEEEQMKEKKRQGG